MTGRDLPGRPAAATPDDRGGGEPAIWAPLQPLRAQPEQSAVLLDYDGTLAPIVADPARARPVPGTGRVLSRLADRFGLVAVVSGRPATFLADVLDRPRGVELFGLYGLEARGPDGEVVQQPAVGPWYEVVAAEVQRARETAPDGVLVEPKGLTLTLHWRARPAAAPWVHRFAAEAGDRSALVAQPGRMALELRPPLQVDKGTVLRQCADGRRAVAFFGDDLGDLPAFAALADLRRAGRTTAAVAVIDAESAPEVAAAADLALAGPAEVLAVLRWLAEGEAAEPA